MKRKEDNTMTNNNKQRSRQSEINRREIHTPYDSDQLVTTTITTKRGQTKQHKYKNSSIEYDYYDRTRQRWKKYVWFTTTTQRDADVKEWLLSVFLLLLEQDPNKILGQILGMGVVRLSEQTRPPLANYYTTHFIPLEENYILLCMAGNGKAA